MMDSEVFEAAFTGGPLSLPSLRLLVPPLQLMTASMWRAVKQQEVVNYWKVAEFISLVTEVIPELLMHKHSTQLNLGLRARYILELCRSEQLVDPEFILSHLDKVKPVTPKPVEENEVEMDGMEAHFLELVQTLLKDSEGREHFFMEVFPVEYGSHYDTDLQTLFYEFLCRLTQFLPIPDLEQTVSWLGSATSVLEECVLTVSAPTDLKNLLKHHKHCGHLEQHVPPSSMGDCIISTLSAIPPSRVALATDQPSCDNQMDTLQCLSDDTNPVSFVDDVAVEIITVTDYAEVELGTSAEDSEVVIEGNCFEGTVIETITEDIMEMLPGQPIEVLQVEKTEGAEVTEAGEEMPHCQSGLAVLVHREETVDDQVSPQHKTNPGPLDCPECEKSFKFASSLLAHRVIHSGERPYRCNECDRCFSFRQSLDRHKHTHKSGRLYDCVVCGEAFQSLSARLEHKQKHKKDGTYVCLQCDRRFGSELALARHLKSDTDGHCAGSNSSGLIESQKTEKAMQSKEEVAEVAVALPEIDSLAPQIDCENCDHDPKEEGSQDSQSSQPEDEMVSLVKVRTSGRRRKPTMKIQVINLQKRIGKDSAAKKRRTGTMLEKPPALKPVPFNSTEHSYGSPMVSAKDGDEGAVGDGSSPAFSCPTCSFCHTDEAHVQQHIDDMHSGECRNNKSATLFPVDQEGRFSCPDCQKCFKFQSLLKAHQRLHTGEQPYLCSQCGRRFSFKQSLERHKQTHKDGREYECLICGEFFKSLAAQREHKSTHMENGDYMCTDCGRAFTWKSALVRHLKTHGDEEEKTERPYKCSHCDMAFGCASYLNRHLQTHKEERLYTCNCGKSFAYQAALKAHQRIHQKERPHQCTQCGKGFLYKGGLLSHMKIHSEEMPFMCSFCGKSFKRERNMKKHERCHTRENVFSCSQCDKSFVYKATLTRHELTHSGERPFLCSDCGKGFFSHAELLKHERFHTGHKPFQCQHCGKKFTQSCYLTIHLRYHTGARPYSCNECEKSFLSANRLKRHQRTHTGEKPYLCGECGKGFKQSYHLKMHQRTHALKL